MSYDVAQLLTMNQKALDELFTRVVATLVDKGLVKVSRISQDGTRVRAEIPCALDPRAVEVG